ncbi:MAG: hypothetical protein F9K29_04040 [Hyphomicrobiaceae bacterium]|nr:MAG: hypothetical protein F9K29_04040 [Hyphomicrobiaceae bacterium]
MPKVASKTKRRPRKSGLDEELDEALEQTFPASDPVAVGGATATEDPLRPVDRKAPEIDKDEVYAQSCRNPALNKPCPED